MNDASTLRKRILSVETSRTEHVNGILREGGPVRPGSLVTVRRRCGKPTCHCTRGQGHLTTYLSTKRDGATHMLYIPAPARAVVASQAQAYRRLRKHRASLAKLSHQALVLIDQYEKTLRTEEGAADDTSR
jgi:hypothetical protein